MDAVSLDPGAPHEERLGDLTRRSAATLAELAERHLVLAKAEVGRDIRTMSVDIVILGVGAAIVAFAYVLLSIALVVALSAFLGLAGALAVVGGANALLGGVGLFRSAARTANWRFLDETLAELRLTVRALAPQHEREVGNGR